MREVAPGCVCVCEGAGQQLYKGVVDGLGSSIQRARCSGDTGGRGEGLLLRRRLPLVVVRHLLVRTDGIQQAVRSVGLCGDGYLHQKPAIHTAGMRTACCGCLTPRGACRWRLRLRLSSLPR